MADVMDENFFSQDPQSIVDRDGEEDMHASMMSNPKMDVENRNSITRHSNSTKK